MSTYATGISVASLGLSRFIRGDEGWRSLCGPGQVPCRLGGRSRRSAGPGRRLFGQPLVGPVPAGEPPGGEGRGAVRRRVGTGFDGRERDTFAGDEGELRGPPG